MKRIPVALIFLAAVIVLLLVIIRITTARPQPGELLPFPGPGENLPIVSDAPQVVLSDLVITKGEKVQAQITLRNTTSHYLWVTVCVAVYREQTKWPDSLFSFSTPMTAYETMTKMAEADGDGPVLEGIRFYSYRVRSTDASEIMHMQNTSAFN